MDHNEHRWVESACSYPLPRTEVPVAFATKAQLLQGVEDLDKCCKCEHHAATRLWLQRLAERLPEEMETAPFDATWKLAPRVCDVLEPTDVLNELQAAEIESCGPRVVTPESDSGAWS